MAAVDPRCAGGQVMGNAVLREPVMILVMGAVAPMIVLAILLPIIEINRPVR